jgi:hypothetical protein
VALDEIIESLRQQCKGYTDSTKLVTMSGTPSTVSPRKNRGGVAMGPEEARLSKLVGGKLSSVGIFYSEDEAAVAYDQAAVRAFRLEAQTNFLITNYLDLLGVSVPLPQCAAQ